MHKFNKHLYLIIIMANFFTLGLYTAASLKNNTPPLYLWILVISSIVLFYYLYNQTNNK